MLIWDKRQSNISWIAALLIFGILSGVLFQWMAGWIAIFIAMAAALFLYYANMRRYFRRRSIVHQPFPQEWRQILERRVAYYRDLPPAARKAFEEDIRIFLSENRITAVSTDVDDTIRLLVSASAVMLLFGHRDWEYRRLPEILIYPSSFDEHYSINTHRRRRNLSGIVVPQNAIVLSKEDLLRAFEPEETSHVALHEFAHALDLADGIAEGVPADLELPLVRNWNQMIRDELKKVREERSVLNPYAGKDRAELFAVAVEHFFQAPVELREGHPQLYEALAHFFNQDPAAKRSNQVH